jgi:membrane-associated phospholipid phosphatase
MHRYRSRALLLLLLLCAAWTSAAAQTSRRDSTASPYHINYWVSGALLAAGTTVNYLGARHMMDRPQISRLELLALDKDVVNSIDRWALRQDVTGVDVNTRYSEYVLGAGVVVPFFLLFDGAVRRDWVQVLVMFLETMSLVPNLYEWSFFGPYFQNRFRPSTYYEEIPMDERTAGLNRSSFYSGHVATVAAATFFAVKVYSDYHPEIGNDKYFLYAAAVLPAALQGYFRVRGLHHFPSDALVGLGIGAVCGVLVPELHRLSEEGLSLGVYSTQEATGVALSLKLR